MSNKSDHKIAFDCQYYLGDRPCIWHKQNGDLCECQHYIPLRESLLIIKLDAMGDVLRTTCLLPVIAKAWPGIRITWITRQESVSLLENNPYIAEVVPYGIDSILHISSRTFNRVINLDAGKISAGLATMSKAKEKIGYILHEDGYVIGTNEAADEWLKMGIFDDLKKVNKRSYQEIMCSIIGLPTDGVKYVLELTDTEKENGRRQLQKLNIDFDKPIIGIHTGGGGRWSLKQWSEDRFTVLIPELISEVGRNVQVLLFGGPLERDLNKRIIDKMKIHVFDAGCDNEVRHFAALVSLCSVVISGDSLAMHVAIAMRKPTIVLFGPTSSSEIDLFGQGEKIIPSLDCLVCYKKTCDYIPNCMDSISADMVKQAILRQLSTIK